jgi:peptide-methionine (S)-S-oxide reductase
VLDTVAELKANHVWERPIVTEVAPLTAYYPAEGYHQDYFNKNPSQPYCAAVVAPKVSKFRKAYFDRLLSS